MLEQLNRLRPDELMGLILGLAFVIFGAAFGIAAIAFDYRKKALMFNERRLMVEKGMTPPSLPAARDSWANTKVQLRTLQFEERRLMIEKGMTPPPMLPDEPPPTPEQRLYTGIVMFCLGIGLSISYFSLRPENEFKELIGFAAPILAVIGAGFIVYSRVARNVTRTTETDARKN